MHKEIEYFNELFRRYPVLEVSKNQIQESYHLLESSFENNGKLLICGNGGSASDAEHIVGELMKGFIKKRPIPNLLHDKLITDPIGKAIADKLQSGLPAIALTSHQTLITAVSNDLDPDLIFAQQVLGYGQPNDVLLAISTSGNSENVIHAAYLASKLGLKIVGLTGKNGGKLLQFCNVTICVPEYETSKIQELHLPIYHTLCSMLEEHFFQN